MWWDGRGTHLLVHPSWQVRTEESGALDQRRGKSKDVLWTRCYDKGLLLMFAGSEMQESPLVGGKQLIM